jgi:hypothetical protein
LGPVRVGGDTWGWGWAVWRHDHRIERKNDPRVSRLALLRFLERVQERDLARTRKWIADEERREAERSVVGFCDCSGLSALLAGARSGQASGAAAAGRWGSRTAARSGRRSCGGRPVRCRRRDGRRGFSRCRLIHGGEHRTCTRVACSTVALLLSKVNEWV